MDKPLYILIFLLLWSNRIRGGEEEDINGSFSPSTQKTGVRNSLIDKASTSTVTKKTTIFDPDSESAEKVSPPIKSKTLDTNTGTVEPSVPNSNTPIPAKESTRKNTTTLSDTDSDSSETQSPSNKPEVPKTTNDSSETNSPPIKSEETKTKPGASEIFLPNSVTIKPASDSTAVNTTESDPDSASTQTGTRARLSNRYFASKKTKTTPARDLDSEPPETYSTSIKSEAAETEFEPSETDSTSIKSEAPETEFGTQQPSFHNFESHELADESSETDSPPFKSDAPAINPASTANAKTAIISESNSDNLEPTIPNYETLGPSKEKSELLSRHTITSRATKATKSKDPHSTTNVDEEIATTVISTMELTTTDSTEMTDKTTTIGDVHNLNCSSNQSDYFKSQTNSSVTLTLSPFGNHSQLCILKWSESNVSECVLSNSSSDITIDGLDSGRPYNFSVYYLQEHNDKTNLSKSTCTVGPYYTRPERPDCSQFNHTEQPKITNTTITLGKYFISNNLCANVTSTKPKSDSHLVFSESIGDLSAATSYKISLFKYLNGSDGPLLSAEGCPLGTFHTLPKDPHCHVIPNKTAVTNRTSKSITLNTTQLRNLSVENQLCVQIYPNPSKCNPVGLISMFDHLNSSSKYNFSVFSYYNVSDNGYIVLSEKHCPLGNYYTLPASPNCKEIKANVTVKSKTATNITLDFTKVAVDIRESLCVKPQYNLTCIHYSSPTMTFQHLNISESYNFSVYSYLDNPFLRSHNSCKILTNTGPDIPVCNRQIVSNRTTTSMLLDLSNLNTTGAVRYIAEIFHDELELKKIFTKNNNFIKNITNLTPGTAYTLRIFAVSKHNIRSTNSCHVKQVYTYPGQPTNESYTQNASSLQFSWSPFGKVDTYDLTVLCHCSCCSCSKNTSISVSNNVTTYNVTELEPGTYCSVNVTATSGGYSSIPLQFNNIETTEKAPGEVSGVNVTNITCNGFTISWSKPDFPNGDLVNYRVNLLNPAETIDVPISTPSTSYNTSFNDFSPGVCYNVSVAAINKIDEGKRIYRTVYTTETVPSIVTNLVTLNTSSTSIAVSWSKPQKPNGVIKGYQILVWTTMEGKIPEQIITLRCGSCQRPCFTALTQDNLQKSRLPYVNKEKDETTTVHNVSFTESNTTLHYEVTGLKIFTSYVFNVTAFTSVGHGEWATNVRKTSEDIPSSVTDLKASNTSSTSIAVTWSKPYHPNGVIKEYQIFVTKTNEHMEGTNLKQIITLKCDCCQGSCPTAVPKDMEKDDTTTVHEVSFTDSNTTFRYEVTGLEIFTSYFFNVTAFTSVGHGKWAKKVANTSEDMPSPPGHPVESNVQIKSLSFVYDKPEKENGVITNQEIEYSYKPYNVCVEDSEFEHTVTKTNMSGIIDIGDKFNASLGNLQPFWLYTIRVRVSTYAGFSNYSQPTTIRTRPTTPGKVSNIIAAQTFSRHIQLKWTQPCHPNGLIINYQIDIWNTNDSSHNTTQTNSNITGLHVTSLLPYCLYNFTVFTEVQNVSNLSEPPTSTLFRTKAEAPYRPGRFTVISNTSTSVMLSWETPELKTGPTTYIVKAIDNETFVLGGSCETLGFYNTTCNITGLDSYWNYLLTVEAIVENFPTNKSTDYDGVRTAQSAPGRVSHFTVTQDSNVTAKTNVLIKWSPPSKRDLNGIITNYFLQYWYQSNQIKTNSYNSTESEATILVEAEKVYTFQIFAKTIENATDIATKRLPIKPGAPLPPPPQKVPLINKGPPASDDQTQIAVAFRRIALCDDSNGKIVKWYIIVSKTTERQVFRGTKNEYLKKIEKRYKKWKDVYEKDVTEPYIASDSWIPHCGPGSRRKRSAPVETISYTLGSDGDCESGNRKYCNGNLEPGQTYRVRYAVCTARGCLESEFSEPFQTAPNHVPAIAGSLTAVVLVLAVIIVVIIVLKRRGKGPFKSLDNGEVGQQNEAFNGVEMKGTSKPKAVKIADFANYVQKLHADSNLLFSSEYKLLKETCPTHTTKAAEVQVNRIKNRYTNILSYDHSRVKLLPTEDDEGSDYINANYMPGYSSPREYIATQGPLPFTRDDFWRMIWEQNVSIIVMLTQLVERGRRKCDIYWPEAAREPVYYGDLVVELESESTLPDYVLRVMSIKLGDRVRKVKQLHYLKWPDMGCPETTWLLLNFVGATRLYLPHNDPGPIVVHCSAGVGRTGTFIAVDYLMQHVRTSDVIDIYSYVMKMRNNRPNMVQTEDQYVFIHDCIKDYVNKNDDDTDDEEEEEEKQEDQCNTQSRILKSQ